MGCRPDQLFWQAVGSDLMSWFDTDTGDRLWYEEHGSGTPIVFIHGWCMSSAVWEHQREWLADSFRVITLDLPGHGKSAPYADDFRIRGCAADVATLIGQLGLDNVIIAGWSLGVLVAIETWLLCKERLSGLVLISGTPRFVQSLDFPDGLSHAEVDGMAKKVQRSIRRARDGFLTHMFAVGEDESAHVHRLLSSIPVPSTDVALQALEALAITDIRDCLPAIDIPTLIMHGDRDVICLPKASDFMTRQIPKSRQVVFSNCGHVPFLTQSKKFNGCLEEFRGMLSGGTYRQK